MGKPNGKMDFTKQMVDSAVAGDNAPVPFSEFEKEIRRMVWMNEMLAQQIIGLDVTLGLLIERVARNFERVENEDGSFTVKITQWPQEQFDEFKAEVKRRVEKVAAQIEAENKKLNANKIIQ